MLSILTVGSVYAIVDFLVLKLFNGNNLLSEAVVGLRLFYPKSFRKTSFFLRSSKRLTLNRLTSHPQNLCHNLKRVWCLLVFNLDGLNFDQTYRGSSCYLLTEHPNAMKITHLLQNKFYFVVVHERRFKFIHSIEVVHTTPQACICFKTDRG